MRWPCSADSSRNAGSPGASARSFKNADTGVSQSAMNVSRRGTRLWALAASGTAALPAALIEHPLRVGQRETTAVKQDEQVVEQVGSLFPNALVALLASGASYLLGVLHHLLADAPRIIEQFNRVRALRALARTPAQGALQAGQGLVRRTVLQLSAIKAGALDCMACRTGRLHERQQ